MRKVSQQIGWSQEAKLYYSVLQQLIKLTAVVGKDIEPSIVQGSWYLVDQYSPALDYGWITFPDHSNQIASLNPNEVGQFEGNTLTQIYINVFNSAGQNKSSFLSMLVSQNRKLTLTQRNNKVIYNCTFEAFEIDNLGTGDEVFADNIFGNSVKGSITILQPAYENFNTTDPITITID